MRQRGRWCTRASSRDAADAKRARLRVPRRRSKAKEGASTLVAQTPDFGSAVIRDEEAAVGQLENGHRTSPNFDLIRREHPAPDDFLHRTGRLAVLEGNEDDLLADAFGTVP